MFRKCQKAQGSKGFILPGGFGTLWRIAPLTLLERAVPINKFASKEETLKHFTHTKLPALPPTPPVLLRVINVYSFKRDLPFMVV